MVKKLTRKTGLGQLDGRGIKLDSGRRTSWAPGARVHLRCPAAADDLSKGPGPAIEIEKP
jgi:hypothetical protein